MRTQVNHKPGVFRSGTPRKILILVRKPFMASCRERLRSIGATARIAMFQEASASHSLGRGLESVRKATWDPPLHGKWSLH